MPPVNRQISFTGSPQLTRELTLSLPHYSRRLPKSCTCHFRKTYNVCHRRVIAGLIRMRIGPHRGYGMRSQELCLAPDLGHPISISVQSFSLSFNEQRTQ